VPWVRWKNQSPGPQPHCAGSWWRGEGQLWEGTDCRG
jgi:hypothetical protein